MNYSIKKELLSKIKENLPGTTWRSAKFVSSGYDHDVVILDNKTVFRFPKQTYAKALLKSELELLKVLGKYLSVKIPEYNFIAKNSYFASYPVIKGTGLTIKKYKGLSLGEKNELASQIAKFLSELHSVPIGEIKNFKVRERNAAQELKKLHKDAGKYLYPNFSGKEKMVFEDFFHSLAGVLNKTCKKVLVHGDFSGNHMILDEKNNLIGVIDFTDRTIHDPAFDFIFLWGFGYEFVKMVHTYYEGDKESILKRSSVFARASAVWNMIEAVKKKKTDYDGWYRNFKKVNRLII